MATPLLPTSPAKRLRSVSFDENIQTHKNLDFDAYNSDEDSDFNEKEYYSNSDYSSIDLDTEVSDEEGSTTSMDISVSNDTDILSSRDGTKWCEDMFVGNQPSTETSSESHGPTITDFGHQATTPLGNICILLLAQLKCVSAQERELLLPLQVVEKQTLNNCL